MMSSSSFETDLFDLLDSSLQRLCLHRNEITTVHEDIFEGLAALQILYLAQNDIGALPADLFDPLDEDLEKYR